MIKINLLPLEQRPITRTPLPHIISLAVMLAVLFFMGQTYLSLNVELKTIDQQIAKQEAALQQLSATVEKYGELEKQKQQLQTMVATIKVILEDRTIWSEHLHKLMTLTPENIWYKRLRLTERRFTEEVPALDKNGNPLVDKNTGLPKMDKKQVPRSILEVSGYAVDDASGMSSTASLAASTTSDLDFSEIFQLYTSRITDTEFNSERVREFIFEYLIL
jgi:uncharacterized coiled-coil protein SlyX